MLFSRDREDEWPTAFPRMEGFAAKFRKKHGRSFAPASASTTAKSWF